MAYNTRIKFESYISDNWMDATQVIFDLIETSNPIATAFDLSACIKRMSGIAMYNISDFTIGFQNLKRNFLDKSPIEFSFTSFIPDPNLLNCVCVGFIPIPPEFYENMIKNRVTYYWETGEEILYEFCFEWDFENGVTKNMSFICIDNNGTDMTGMVDFSLVGEINDWALPIVIGTESLLFNEIVGDVNWGAANSEMNLVGTCDYKVREVLTEANNIVAVKFDVPSGISAVAQQSVKIGTPMILPTVKDSGNIEVRCWKDNSGNEYPFGSSHTFREGSAEVFLFTLVYKITNIKGVVVI